MRMLARTTLLALSVASGLAAQDATVTIRFAAMVGPERFACGRTYQQLGTAPSSFTPTEFRMFVHHVRLVTADGREIPVTLDTDGRWQADGVALVDFEDGSGPCSNGTPELRTDVQGKAPAEAYRGLRFSVGVPFAVNHLEPVTQPSPLNLTRMFWSWNSGHKFLRLDGRTGGGKNWVLHLGSTGCTPAGGASVVPTACAQRNVAEIFLPAFDPATDIVVADVAALYAGNNLEQNQEGTAAGCMSSPTDRDCAAIFASLGLLFPGMPVTAQPFFRGVRASSLAVGQP
jgi:uncharacterized repeat protein (TIGR04052 family)